MNGDSCDWLRLSRRLKVAKVVLGRHLNLYVRCAGMLVSLRNGNGAVARIVWNDCVLGLDGYHKIEYTTKLQADYYYFSHEGSVTWNRAMGLCTYESSSIPINNFFQGGGCTCYDREN